jgi:hypothetical protein
VYQPGGWQPKEPFYNITSLPGIGGLPIIRIESWNAGGGVIAYRIIPDPELLVALVAAYQLVKVGITVVQAQLNSRLGYGSFGLALGF